MFRWSSYWNRWSRVLARFESSGCIELNLTSIYPYEWNTDVRSQIVRVHCTISDRRDKLVTSLPVGVIMTMRQNLQDNALVEKLLTYNYIGEKGIDRVVKGQRHGGGTPWHLI